MSSLSYSPLALAVAASSPVLPAAASASSSSPVVSAQLWSLPNTQRVWWV